MALTRAECTARKQISPPVEWASVHGDLRSTQRANESAIALTSGRA